MTSYARDIDHDVRSLLGNGDSEGALQLLMLHYGQDVYQLCRRIVRDSTLAEDVRQQVFLSAYQDLPRFECRSRFRSWLLGISYHRALDALKSRRRRELREVEFAEHTDVYDPGPSALESIDGMRLRAVLDGVLGNLGEPARAAVVMRFHQERTFEEMAAICDEDAAVLRNRVSRALRRLRSAVAARTDDAADARGPAALESRLSAAAMHEGAAWYQRSTRAPA